MITCSHVKKRKRISKKRMGLKKIDVPDEVVKNSDEFEERMERMAHKLNLNRTQVKSVIRNLVEVPELFGRVQQLAGEMNSDTKLDQTDSQIRVTRKLAK